MPTVALLVAAPLTDRYWNVMAPEGETMISNFTGVVV